MILSEPREAETANKYIKKYSIYNIIFTYRSFITKRAVIFEPQRT